MNHRHHRYDALPGDMFRASCWAVPARGVTVADVNASGSAATRIPGIPGCWPTCHSWSATGARRRSTACTGQPGNRRNYEALSTLR
jgi:hypothetical protein